MVEGTTLGHPIKCRKECIIEKKKLRKARVGWMKRVNQNTVRPPQIPRPTIRKLATSN